MNQELKLLGGISILLISLGLGYRELKNWKTINEKDNIRKSLSIKKTGGIIGLLMVSLVAPVGCKASSVPL